MVGPGRSWSVPGHSPVGHGRFMMSVPDVSPQFQSWVRHLRHAGMALKYLWARSPCRRPVRRPLSHAITCIRWVPLPVCAGAYTSLSLPLSAAIDLHEIHLAPQPSLQVPVGHIPVPGGIKLCSPGTFLVANYVIINNGSYQVNFTKLNRATIRYTNSQ